MKSKIGSSSLFCLYAACQGFYVDISFYSQLTAWSEAPTLPWSAPLVHSSNANKGDLQRIGRSQFIPHRCVHCNCYEMWKAGEHFKCSISMLPSQCHCGAGVLLGLIFFPYMKKKGWHHFSCVPVTLFFIFILGGGELMEGMHLLVGNSLSFWFSN